MTTNAIKVKYFALLSERFGLREEMVELGDAITSLSTLKQHLGQRGDVWKQYLLEFKEIAVAVNQAVELEDVTLKAGDEVAFFPPVSGG